MAETYVITSDARQDLLDIERYVLSYASEEFVNQVEADFFNAFERLPREALMHPVYPFDRQQALAHEYRSVNVYNYKVFYWLRGSRVVISRILHLSSDFTRPRW